jgi:cardiolipin synthase
VAPRLTAFPSTRYDPCVTFANAGFLVLGLIVGVLALIGVLDAVKGTPVRAVVPFGGAAMPAVRDPEFLRTMALATHVDFCTGNAVQFFWNGDQMYPLLWEDLRTARQSITLELYYCKPGRMADMLKDVLIERAKAGVHVLFLYDAWGTSLKKEYMQALTDGGVRTAKFRPINLKGLHHINHRAHVRVVCIDGRIGWTGGFGIDDKWFGNGRVKNQWRDSNVRFTGPAVAHLQSAFSDCWAEATGDLLIGETLFPAAGEPPADSAGTLLAGVLHGTPAVGSTEAERYFALSIAAARKKLYITNSYFVPDRDFRRLIAAAARRGVDTRVLTVSKETDIKSTWYAGRARYEQLLEAGVRIYEYRPTMMHAKTLVVDGHWAAVGTMNADNRSLSFNEETVLLMLADDAGATLEKHFMDDLAHADEIQLETFRRRGFINRAKESVCYAFWRIL